MDKLLGTSVDKTNFGSRMGSRIECFSEAVCAFGQTWAEFGLW